MDGKAGLTDPQAMPTDTAVLYCIGAILKSSLAAFVCLVWRCKAVAANPEGSRYQTVRCRLGTLVPLRAR